MFESEASTIDGDGGGKRRKSHPHLAQHLDAIGEKNYNNMFKKNSVKMHVKFICDRKKWFFHQTLYSLRDF